MKLHTIFSTCTVVLAFAFLANENHAAPPTSGGTIHSEFGTFERPFSARSYWNIRPVGVQLGGFQIPDSSYRPLVGGGAYSSTAFLADSSDKPQQIFGAPGKRGLWELDGEQFVDSITVPRWPADVIPASGSDGHADIVDPVQGVIHSFLRLRKDKSGRWTADMYAWTRLDGRGWGDPAHYYQGARAAAVPPMAGLIRKHEVDDGQALYRHALAISMTYNALSARKGYVFPATSADGDWKINTGEIPEGALMMLPESFDTRSIEDKALRKVAETLKVYGGYVVDRNLGTPFYVYVENGSSFGSHKNRWSDSVEQDLKRIQRGLRQVVSVQKWIDGNGEYFTPQENLNMLSMRGPWVKTSGSGTAHYDTQSQSVILSDIATGSEFQHRNNRSFGSVEWAAMKPGQLYTLRANATQGGSLELKLFGKHSKRLLFNSDWLNNTMQVEFTWPSEPVNAVLTVRATKDSREAVRIQGLVHANGSTIENPLSQASVRGR